MNVAVFLPNWVGDVVMATPTIRALHEQNPRPHHLIGIVHPRVIELLSGNPWFDRVIPYEWGAKQFVNARRQLRAESLDQAVILPNARHPAVLAWLAGARQCVGYVRRRRGFFLTTKLQPPMRDGKFIPCSTLDYYLNLAIAAGCTPRSKAMELFTTPEEEAAADAVWSANGWSSSESVVAINNGGAFGPAKMWPEEYATELARRIGGRRVLFLCGPAERESASRAAAAAGAASLAHHLLGLGLTKACLKRCRMLITTDSGPRHIAAAFGLRVVTLFGPTDEAWSDTGYPRESRLSFPIECRPCQQRECPLGHHRCMKDLSVDTVWTKVSALLGDSM